VSVKAYLYGNSDERKEAPMCEGVLWYFPDALAAVAAHSLESNRRHNPGERMHHARDKSSDHADCILRHLAHAAPVNKEGISERVAIAWRALAFLQEGLEELHGLPLPANARLSRNESHDFIPTLKPGCRWRGDAPRVGDISPDNSYLNSFDANPHPMSAEALRGKEGAE